MNSLTFRRSWKQFAVVLGIIAVFSIALAYSINTPRYKGLSMGAWIDEFQMGHVSANQLDEALANFPSHEIPHAILKDVVPRLSKLRRKLSLVLLKAPRWIQDIDTIKNLGTLNHKANERLLQKTPIVRLVAAASKSNDPKVRT